MPIRRYKPTSAGPPLHVRLHVRGGHEVGAGEEPARAALEEGRPQRGTAGSRRATREAATSAATASSTSSAGRTACRRRSPRSSTTRTGRRGSRCSTTPTARRATSSRPRSCGSARPSSRDPTATSASATHCRSRTSRRARSSTRSSSSRARARRWPARPARGSSWSQRTAPSPCCGFRRGDAPRAAHLPRDDRPGREPRPPEHHGRQGRPQPLARQAPVGARLRDEPGRPSARRRRGQVEGRSPPGDARGACRHSASAPAASTRNRTS